MRFTLRMVDLEVFYRVGVGDEERAEAQRLMVTVEMEVDAPRAAVSDDLRDTVDYFEVSQAVLRQHIHLPDFSYRLSASGKSLPFCSGTSSHLSISRFMPPAYP